MRKRWRRGVRTRRRFVVESLLELFELLTLRAHFRAKVFAAKPKRQGPLLVVVISGWGELSAVREGAAEQLVVA